MKWCNYFLVSFFALFLAIFGPSFFYNSFYKIAEKYHFNFVLKEYIYKVWSVNGQSSGFLKKSISMLKHMCSIIVRTSIIPSLGFDYPA